MKTQAKLFIIIVLIIIQLFFSVSNIASQSILMSSNYNINEKNEQGLSEAQKALQEIAYSYYVRGTYLQYNQRKFDLFSPEEATSQNNNYIICSSFIRNVYNELLDIKTPRLTTDLLKYSKEYIGNSEVIAYGEKNGNDMVMKLYDSTEANNYKTINNPSLSYILPYLRVGDILTYTGHTILVYDIIYDRTGKPTDAIIMQSGSGSGHYVKSKIEQSGKFLIHNSRPNTEYGNNYIEGSINLTLLTNRKEWVNINTSSKKDEYSILRFLQKDKNGNDIINYKGINYGDSNHEHELVNLSNKVNDRLKFRRLYIEKIVDAHADNMVSANDELKYTITIKNNSTENYTNDITVKEYISDYVKYKNFTVTKNNTIVNIDLENKKIEWNIGKLQVGEEVQINYTVIVKENCYGKTIESTGNVENIPSSIVKNSIGYKLTEEQSTKIQEKYNTLKNQYNGKELINEIYKESFDIDLEIDEFDITDLIKNTNIESTAAATISLNKNNIFANYVLNNYWSAMVQKTSADSTTYDLKFWREYTDSDRRSDTIYKEDFKTGDILIYLNQNDVKDGKAITYEDGEYAYIYLEGQGFCGINLGKDGIRNTQDDRNQFNNKYYTDNGLSVYSVSETTEDLLDFYNYQSLFGKDYYVILRPSIAVDIVPMELNINYSLSSPTNQDITVTITSNEEMGNIEGWSLSENKKTLTKTYTKNTEEQLKVYDYGGNEKIVNIKIDNIDKEKPSLDINYSTTKATNKDVIVTINSNEAIENINGWTISKDKKTLSKTFNNNTEETITATDTAGNAHTILINIKNIDKENPTVHVKYGAYESAINGSIVTIESNEELLEIEGWQLSTDKKSLTKTYFKNTEETINIYDLAGNSVIETIKVANIIQEKPQYEVKYSTTLSTNDDVVVTISSTEEMQGIDGWKLSEDKKVLTKTYSQNIEEEIFLKNLLGNNTSKTIIKINNIDKVKPEINISYNISELTNQDIYVTIAANEELKELEGWNLSKDKKELKKKYISNTDEIITISDLAGNTISDTIKITNIDKAPPKIEIKYSTTAPTDKDVIVTIISDKRINNIDGWTLSNDKKQLSKTFIENNEEEINIADEAGNSITTIIKVSNIDKVKENQVDMKDISYNDLTKSTGILPQTGEKSICILVVLLMIISTIMYIKTKKYKDMK